MAIKKPLPPDAPANAESAERAIYAKAKNDWVRADEEAFSIIGLSVDDDQIVHIRHESSLGAWTKLKNYHENASMSNEIHLM